MEFICLFIGMLKHHMVRQHNPHLPRSQETSMVLNKPSMLVVPLTLSPRFKSVKQVPWFMLYMGLVDTTVTRLTPTALNYGQVAAGESHARGRQPKKWLTQPETWTDRKVSNLDENMTTMDQQCPPFYKDSQCVLPGTFSLLGKALLPALPLKSPFLYVRVCTSTRMDERPAFIVMCRAGDSSLCVGSWLTSFWAKKCSTQLQFPLFHVKSGNVHKTFQLSIS